MEETMENPDWTCKDGRANSSDLYLEIVADVADSIRNARVGDDPTSEARTIVSRLAHLHKMRPQDVSEEERLVNVIERTLDYLPSDFNCLAPGAFKEPSKVLEEVREFLLKAYQGKL
jgi:hypothetical protein